jgi:uncharacterized protein (DUF488 family)
MERLYKLASEHRTTLMCAEVLWWRCHRALVSDVLMVEGVNAMHIQDEKRVVEHPFTGPARLYKGTLTYDSAKGEVLNDKERGRA